MAPYIRALCCLFFYVLNTEYLTLIIQQPTAIAYQQSTPAAGPNSMFWSSECSPVVACSMSIAIGSTAQMASNCPDCATDAAFCPYVATCLSNGRTIDSIAFFGFQCSFRWLVWRASGT
ncbi:MAG: hypothetical protein C4K49_03275 [Candidatus Thorarchaeota archaeon]|nr:MAG: hypothetical protein C4K49_03275 [Candidatus Thorarchaeota archaeon]